MSQGTRDLRKKAPHCVPTQPREKRGSQFLRRPQGRRACLLLQERGWDLGSFWKYDDPLPSQDRLGSLRALKALRGLAPSLSRLFRALHLSQPTGPAPLLGPLTAFPSGEQLWPPPVWPPALAGKTISFCLRYPSTCPLEFSNPSSTRDELFTQRPLPLPAGLDFHL